MRTAVDSNVISALWSHEPAASRIAGLLGSAQSEGGLAICASAYAELLAYPRATGGFLDEFLRNTNVVVDFLLDEEVWKLAAEAFAAYAHKRRKSREGIPKRLLADFIIGAHATLRCDRLFTLDKSRYEGSFPRLRLLE